MGTTIDSITLGVSDLHAGIEFFRDTLGLKVVRDSRASVGLLSAWHRPVHESLRLVELGADDERSTRVRLAHFEDEPSARSFRDPSPFGPRVVGFQLPAAIAKTLEHAAASAPDNLPELVTSFPRTTASGVTAMVVVAPDMAASTRFYEALDYIEAPMEELPGPTSARLRALAGGAPPSLVRLKPRQGSGCDIVLVQSAKPIDIMPAEPARIAPRGIILVSYSCDDLDEIRERTDALALEPFTQPTHIGLPNGRPGRVMLMHGPAHELFEFVEFAA